MALPPSHHQKRRRPKPPSSLQSDDPVTTCLQLWSVPKHHGDHCAHYPCISRHPVQTVVHYQRCWCYAVGLYDYDLIIILFITSGYAYILFNYKFYEYMPKIYSAADFWRSHIIFMHFRALDSFPNVNLPKQPPAIHVNLSCHPVSYILSWNLDRAIRTMKQNIQSGYTSR